MADVNVNAKIFIQMQSADQQREEMRKNILAKAKAYLQKGAKALGAAYDSPLARGTVGGLRDTYRRAFENGWYSKDVFDGRWNMDNRVGQENHTVESMGQQYDLRASFYGWDQANGTDKAKENQVEREDDLGR
jgi:hypothetical protein